MLSDIGEDKSRIEALDACGEILIQNDGQILPDIVPQRPSLQLRTIRFKQVCSSLGIEDIDCFVSDTLATTEGDFSNYLRYIFTEISRIYGWNSEEWRKIYEKLA